MMKARGRIMVAIAVGAAVLGFGATGGVSAPVQAFDEEAYVEDVVNCQTLDISSYCDTPTSTPYTFCYSETVQTCGDMIIMTGEVYYPFNDANGDNICGLYVYCP